MSSIENNPLNLTVNYTKWMFCIIEGIGFTANKSVSRIFYAYFVVYYYLDYFSISILS